jgi:murein DD-endopeptidase MepM/ murein hydrolase activator NlpD
MALNKNTTNNGIDINEVDVSKLALVDKANLIDELTKSLEKGISDAFMEATDNLSDDLGDLIDEKLRNTRSAAGGSSTGTGKGYTGGAASRGNGAGSRSSSSSTPKANPNKEFEKRLQLQEKAIKNTEKALLLQRKFDREVRRKQIEQKGHSTNGLRYAGQIDDVVEEMHSYSPKKLDDAKKQLSMMRKNVKDNTFGEEQKLLTEHIMHVENALDSETKRRNTILGKIGSHFSKNNINAISIVGALSADSPLAGYVAKHAMDTFRKHSEKGQRKDRDRLMVTDKLQSSLPHPPKNEVEDKNMKVSSDVLRPHLIGLDQETRNATIDNLHKNGHISAEQHKALKAELLPPSFVAAPAPVQTPPTSQAVPQAAGTATQTTTSTPSTPTPVATTAPVEAPPPPIVPTTPVESKVEKLSEYDQYHKTTTKEDQHVDEKNAWLHHMGAHSSLRAEQERKKYENRPKFKDLDPESDEYKFYSDPDVVGPEAYDAPPSSIKLYERMAKSMSAVAMPPHFNSPQPEPQKVEPIHEPEDKTVRMAQAALAGKPPEVETTFTPDISPERVSSPDASQATTVKQIEKADETEVKELHSVVGNSSKLEKLSEEQLVELKNINKTLTSMVESSRLAADAARRETKEGPSGVMADALPEKEKKSGGMGGILKFVGEGLLEALGMSAGKGTFGKIGSFFKGGAKGEKGTGLFGKIAGAFRGAKNGENGALVGEQMELFPKLAGGVEAGAKAEGGVGMFGKMFGGLGKMGGKLGGFSKLLGKAALPLTIIFGIIDFFEGFINAEKILGGNKKLTIMDRVAGGLGNVVKGLVGIIDFITGLVGLKTDIGGWAGRVTGKVFQLVFKTIGGIFTAIGDVAKILMKFPQVKFFIKAIEALGSFIEAVVDCLNDLSDGKNPLEALTKVWDNVTDSIMDMFISIQDKVFEFLDFLHIPHPKGLSRKGAAPSNAPSDSGPNSSPSKQNGPPSPTAPGLPENYDPKTGTIKKGMSTKDIKTDSDKVVPVDGGVVSSVFGPRDISGQNAGASRDHKGLDLAKPMGSPIVASAAGEISYKGTESGYGNVVKIKHEGGFETTYGHMSKFADLRVGQKVEKGEEIGKVGNTGISTGPHLHFEVKKDGQAVDPSVFFSSSASRPGKGKRSPFAGSKEEGSKVETASAEKGSPSDGSKVETTGSGIWSSINAGFQTTFGTAALSSSNSLNNANMQTMPLSSMNSGAVGGQSIDPQKMAHMIARKEGYYQREKDGSFSNTIPRRNNNPGDLRATSKDQPQDKNGYRIFATPEEGFAALESQIQRSAAKQGGLNMNEFFAGKGSYKGYASKAAGNDPNEYADFVAKGLGVDPTKPLTFSTDTPLSGVSLAKASTENSNIQRQLAKGSGSAPMVIAPTSNVVQNNSTQMADIRAKNTETTYQRNMDRMYVPV